MSDVGGWDNDVAFAFADEDELDEPKPFAWVYFDDRDDAFEAVEAADILGLTWQLTTRWHDGPCGAVQQWVIELSFDTVLPLAASGSITRCGS